MLPKLFTSALIKNMKEARLFKTDLSIITLEEMSEILIYKNNISVAVCNANSVVRGARSGGIAKMLNTMSHKICDGYPLSKGINFLYKINQERVDGYNLFFSTIEKGLKENTSHYFFGNEEKVLEKFLIELKSKYPEVNIEGHHCPPMLDWKEFTIPKYLNMFEDLEADVIWVSLGFPKQEKFMEYLVENKVREYNILGVGNVFDWVAKTKYKAPEIFAKNGFEWLFRFIQEPFRLARRYIIDNTFFAYFFLKQYLSSDKTI
tara:strand:- start:4413 stop:5198 length:786 start_codon:yes stop_codon:yes gene_type:complete